MAIELTLDNMDIGKANPHDGTRGRWTFIPAEDKILVKDQLTEKVYSLNMTEITAYEYIDNGGDINLNQEGYE